MGKIVKQYAGYLILLFFLAAFVGSVSLTKGSDAANLATGPRAHMAVTKRIGVGTIGPEVVIAAVVATAIAAKETGSPGMVERR